MLITSNQLPLDDERLLEVKKFNNEAIRDGRLIVLGEVPYSLRLDYLEHLSEGGATGHIKIYPEDYREVAIESCRRVAQKVLSFHQAEDVAVYYPWRGGLLFAFPFVEFGVTKHFHFGVRRNEKEPDKTEEVYLPLDEEAVRKYLLARHILADPMLATGGTIETLMKKLLELGVKERQITVANLLAAPEGPYNLLHAYPDIKIITGTLDDHLDKNGYLVPGIGDMGEKFKNGLLPYHCDPIRSAFSDTEWKMWLAKLSQSTVSVN